MNRIVTLLHCFAVYDEKLHEKARLHSQRGAKHSGTSVLSRNRLDQVRSETSRAAIQTKNSKYSHFDPLVLLLNVDIKSNQSGNEI